MQTAQEVPGKAPGSVDPHRMNPTQAEERIATIDMLRGFALFGILFVNLSSPTMGGFTYTQGHGIDYFVFWIVDNFFQRKFYPLFSFLFGAGMALQMIRANRKGVEFSAIYARRLLVLFFVGLAHAFFVWSGDVLHQYALMGAVLLLFRKSSNKTLIITSALLIALSTMEQPITKMLSVAEPSSSGLVGPQSSYIYTVASYSELVFVRIQDWVRDKTHWQILIQKLDVLGMFLLGLYVGRRGILQDLPGNLKFIRKVLFWALMLVFLGEGWELIRHVVGQSATVFSSILNNSAARAMTELYYSQALSMSYACVFILILQSRYMYRSLLWIANIGRMALTNYLTHSIIGMFLFYRTGFGLHGKLGYLAGITIAIGIYAMQIPFSVWWLRRFRFGPMEWLWRSLTYGELQPMRLRKT
jgi:uncharacterized protein